MRRLYDNLRTCAKEEEVKAEFCKFLLQIYSLGFLNPDVEYFK